MFLLEIGHFIVMVMVLKGVSFPYISLKKYMVHPAEDCDDGYTEVIEDLEVFLK